MKRFTQPSKRQNLHQLRYQGGFSLMESVVSLSISLVVTAAMVALMSNSLSNTSRIVNMTKLSDDLRSTMQMLTRDVRRASYNASAYLCYGNEDCFSDGTQTISEEPLTLTMATDIVINDDENCFTFQLDRDHRGDSTDDDAGGFRLNTVGDIGVLEMWTGDWVDDETNGVPDCEAVDEEEDDNWVAVTNTATMNITDFSVDDALSYTQVSGTLSQRVRKIRFRIDAQLVAAPNVTRRIEDVISIRNDFVETVAAL